MDFFPGVPPFEVFLGTPEAVWRLEIPTEERSVRGKEKGGKDYSLLETWKKHILFAKKMGTYNFLEKLTNPMISRITQLYLS